MNLKNVYKANNSFLSDLKDQNKHFISNDKYWFEYKKKLLTFNKFTEGNKV